MGSQVPNPIPDIAGMGPNQFCPRHPHQILVRINQTLLCRPCMREKEQIAAMGLVQLRVGYPDPPFDLHNAHYSCKQCMLTTLEEAAAWVPVGRCFYHPDARFDRLQANPCEECRRDEGETMGQPPCCMHPDIRRRPEFAYCYKCEIRFRRSRIRCGWRFAKYSLAEMRQDIKAMEDFLLACARQKDAYFPDTRGDPTIANTTKVLEAMYFLKAQFEALGEIPAH